MWTISATLVWAEPWWLLAGVAVVGPLFAHWWANRPGQPTVFPAVELLAKAQHKPIRWQNLRDLILLALRCAIVVLAAVAFAQPLWQPVVEAATDQPVEQQTIAVVIDASGSMQQRVRGGSAFSAAKQQATALLRSLDPRRDRATVLVAGKTIEPVWPEASHRLDALADAIPDIPVSNAYVNLSDAIETARSVEPIDQIHVFTDGQAAAWPEPPSRNTILHPVVAGDASANAAIESVRTEPGLAVVGRPTTLVVAVQNHGPVPLESTVSVDGLADVHPQPLAIPVGEVREARLTFVIGRNAPVTVTARLETKGDMQPADDEATLTIQPRQAISVDVAPELALIAECVEPSNRSPFKVAGDDPMIDIVTSTTGNDPADRLQAGASVLIVGEPATDSAWSPVTGQAVLIDDARLNPATAAPGALSAFDDDSLLALADLPLRRAFRLTPAPGSTVLMRFADDSPAIIERPYGRGRVICLAFDVDESTADAPIFLPLLHELLHRLIAIDGPIARPTLDPLESELARLPDNVETRATLDAPMAEAGTAEAMARPLWPWILVSMVGLLVIESVIAGWPARDRISEVTG